MSELNVKAEFTMWFEAAEEAIKAIETRIAATPIDITKLEDDIDDLAVAIDGLEQFRSTPKGKTCPYDFTTAIPILGKAKQLIVKARRRTKPVQETKSEPPTNQAAKKIPELRIEQFSGDVTKFANFMRSFEMKFNNLSISDSERLVQLRDNVSDGPLKIIEALAITDENYALAISNLKKQYDQPEEIVTALYRKLEQIPPATNNPNSLLNTYYEVQGTLSALAAHGHDLNTFPPLRDNVYSRYPNNVIQQICVNERLPVEKLQNEILKMAQFRMKLDASKSKTTTTTTPKHAVTASLTASKNERHDKREKSPQQANVLKQRPIPPCAFCEQTHYSASCTNVTTLERRLQLVGTRCNLCLKLGHEKTDCRRQITCHYCKQVNLHHSSLCPQQFGKTNSTNTQPVVTPATAQTSTTNLTANTANTKAAYFIRTHKGAHITAIVTVENPITKKRYQLRALFDNGSNESYVDATAARRIGLQTAHHRTVPVTVFLKNKPVNLETATTTFILTNNDDFCTTVVVDTSPAIPQAVHLFDYVAFAEAYPQHATKPMIDQGQERPIELLIGSDYYYDILENKITVDEGLYLYGTKFGWMLVGRQFSESHPRATYLALSPATAINELCTLDSLGITELPVSKIEEEERALEQFYANIRFENNRYVISWPWRSYPPNLPNNFGLAIGRLKTFQRKLTAESFERYNTIIETQIKNGIVEEVPQNEIEETKHFLPHHVVITPEKSTAERLVYEGNAKTRDSYSINDLIYKGINLISDGGKIILRFRLRALVVVADVEKAFHALGINKRDANYVCFVWLQNWNLPPTGRNLRILRFLRVVFGITASPFLLHATIRYHLKKYAKDFPLFVKLLIEDGFVDNVVTGFVTIIQAIAFYQFAIRVFNDCSMNLRKWATNNEKLRDQFAQPDKSSAISILGVIWDQYTDTIHLKPINEEPNATLRIVLSNTAQFYDPCGWWAPLTVTAKIFLREIHPEYKWDEELNEKHRQRWETILTSLQQAANTIQPRLLCVIDDKNAEFSLHLFTDASAKACACAVYLRKHEPYTNTTEVHLVLAKTKLAKITQIPKLELIAVLMGVRALEYVADAIQVPCEKFLWCDAKCVLSWIASDKILPVFIQKQVENIRNVPNIEKRYVTSNENAADLPSRGALYDEINEQWFRGPQWLQLDKSKWPPATIPDISINEPSPLEPRTITVISKTNESPFDINAENYSHYLKLIRVTAYLVQFLSSFSIAQQRHIFPNEAANFVAVNMWIKKEQQNYYHEVITAIAERQPNALVSKLNLYEDGRGILRCAGRFKHAPLTANERCPILLPPPKASRFVRLLVEFYHEAVFHANGEIVLAAFRRKYWIPAGRRAIRNVVYRCTRCKQYRARPYAQPQHSDVPAFRFNEHETPFQAIGIDTFGPLWSNGEKRYVLLVTDLVIRAVDLELLENMAAKTTFLALRIIIARRTRPTLIVSDNAAQFKTIANSCAAVFTHAWEWKFIPEHSPWEGGVYERMVGIVKNAILYTFHNRGTTDILLRTTLAEIANAVNDRPLTYVRSETDEIEPLTPNHFLRSYFKEEEIGPCLLDAEKITITERHLITIAKCCEANNQQFWSKWRTHYLQFLRERGFKRNETFPRQTTTLQPTVGAIVLIAEKLKKRSQWKLGRIIQLNVSSDGKIRSVALKTEHGVLIRPLAEIYPLEITEEPKTTATATAPELPADSSHNNDAVIDPTSGVAENASDTDEWDNPEVTVEIVEDYTVHP